MLTSTPTETQPEGRLAWIALPAAVSIRKIMDGVLYTFGISGMTCPTVSSDVTTTVASPLVPMAMVDNEFIPSERARMHPSRFFGGLRLFLQRADQARKNEAMQRKYGVPV